MSLKVIGSGFGRTGTLSMRVALGVLDLGRCHHKTEVMENPTQPAHWKAVAAYRRNNQRVRDTIPADRLLLFNVADGWEPLCRFLELSVPDTVFPHRHPKREFREHFGGETA